MSEEKKSQDLLSKKKKGIIAGSIVASVVIAGGIVGGFVGGMPQNKGYTLTISSELEGFEDKDLTVSQGTRIKDLRSMITSPVEGYKIAGFYKDMDCTESYNDEDVINENTKIYIKFDAITFTVRAYLDTSKTVLLEEKEVEYNKSAKLMVPTKEPDKVAKSYEFLYWTDAMGREVDLSDIESDMEVYAKFHTIYNEYNINAFASQVKITRGGGDDIIYLTSENTLHYGDRVNITRTTTEGFKETGFNVVGANKVEGTDNLYEITGNLTITYTEERLTYVVGNIPSNTVITRVQLVTGENVNENVTAETVLTHGDILKIEYNHAGYHQTGMETVGLYQVDSDNKLYGVNGNIAITIEEEINSATYNFYNGDTLVSTVTVAHGGNVAVPADQTKDEDEDYTYTFIGWKDTNGNAVTNFNNIEVLTDGLAINIYADYEAEQKSPLTFALLSDGSGYEVTGLKDNSVENLVIPATYKGRSVGRIKSYAFYGNKTIKSVTIEESVTSIGSFAFSYCSKLSSITIPSSITSIENGSFSNCRNLTSVIIEEGITSIGDSAFDSCNSLTEITIPSSVTSIESSAFQSCTNLASITIPINVTSIGERAFSYCSKLTSIIVEEGNTKYTSRDSSGNEVNAIIDKTTNVLIRGSNTTIIPSDGSVTIIGDGAFSRCTSLTSVTIPSNITIVKYSAFADCTSLTSITISNSVTSIWVYTFEGCTSLTSVNIESPDIYNAANGTDYDNAGYLLQNATTIKVLKTIVDDPNNTNTFLNDSSKYTKTSGTGEDSDYYIYTKV